MPGRYLLSDGKVQWGTDPIADAQNSTYYETGNAAIEAVQSFGQQRYSEQAAASALLEKWSALLKNSNGRNKLAVLFVNQSIEASALARAVSNMREQGTAVVVLALGTEGAGNPLLEQIPGVYPVHSMLDLRLKISDIYQTFSELKERGAVPELSARTLPSVDNRYPSFKSDLKGKYIFGTNENVSGVRFGVSMASILNIYGCLPAMAVRGGDSYDLFSDGPTAYSLMKGNAADMAGTAVDEMFEFYEAMQSAMESDAAGVVKSGKVHDDAVKAVILKNLKRRFPVLLVRNGSAAVITGYTQENGSEIFDLYTYGQGAQEGISLTNDSCWVLDTFAYLLEIAKKFSVSDVIDPQESFYANIRFTYPPGYDSNKIKAFQYEAGGSLEAQEITFDTNTNIAKIESPADGSCILVGLETTYAGILPNLYGANKLYQVIQYEDLQEAIADPWYYLYLFQATNRGIINGDIDETGTVNFNPQGNVTRAEFLKMVIEAAGISTGGVIDRPDEHWAKNYLDYALKIKLIDQTQYQDPDANLPRCEAAYILSAMFIDQAIALQAPSLIYKYHTGIFTPKNVAWLEGSAFADQGASNFYNAAEVYQMYMNGVMEGDENRYFHPIADITRAEICKAVMKCMFDLSADIKAANVVFDGYSNFTEFDNEYTKPADGWKDYHFNAERSGYYFVGVKGGAMTAQVDECSGGGTGGGLRYSRLTDDFTETYQSFGEGVPDYITNNMVKNGYSYKRFYLEKGTSFRVSGLQGNHTAFQVLAPKDGDIAFRPTGGGKFIFSNNIEGIDKASTADNGDNSHMIMQVKNLQPDYYTFMAWHKNEAWDGLDGVKPINGKDVYVDVQFRANIETTIRFTGVGIQIPQQNPESSEMIFQNEWTSTQAFANYKKTTIGGREKYGNNEAQPVKYCGEAYQNFDVAVTLRPGESVWLRDLYNDYIGGIYPALLCSLQNPIYIIMDFEVVSGNVDFNEMAYADKSNIVDFYSSDFSGAVAPYRWDTMTKGVADTKPEVVAEVNYKFGETSQGILPTRLFNSYNPCGKEAEFWFTHLNPQNDPYAHPFKRGDNLYATRDISAESDIVNMKYKDSSKIEAYETYGDIPNGEKADTWYFDVYHILCKDPQYQLINDPDNFDMDTLTEAPEAVPGFQPNDLLPRLDTGVRFGEIVEIDGIKYIRTPSSFKLSGGGGNYSVATTYDFKFENTSDVVKRVDFHLFSWQNNVIRTENLQTGEVQLFSMGERVNVNTTTSDEALEKDENLDYVVSSMIVPPGKSEYKVSVILVTANQAGMKQYFTVENQSY